MGGRGIRTWGWILTLARMIGEIVGTQRIEVASDMRNVAQVPVGADTESRIGDCWLSAMTRYLNRDITAALVRLGTPSSYGRALLTPGMTWSYSVPLPTTLGSW